MGFDFGLGWVKKHVVHPVAQAFHAVEHVSSQAAHAALTGVEQFAAFDHKVYSDLVARPLSTALMTLGGGDLKGAVGEDAGIGTIGEIFQPKNWAANWKRAKYVSPGQAFSYIDEGGASQLKVDINNPLSVKNYFSHGSQKWFSGGEDAAASWFGDPLVVGGKVGKIVKGAKSLDAMIKANQVKMAGEAAGFGKGGIITPEIRDAARMKAMDKASQQGGLFDRIIKATDGKSANQILQYNFARQSTNGPLIAHLLSTAGSDTEKAQIFRLSLGDKSAYTMIQDSNKELANQIDDATSRWSALSNNIDHLEPGSTAYDIAKTQMAEYQKKLGDLDQRYGVIKAKLEAYNTLDTIHYGTGSRFAAHARAIRHDTIQPSIYDRPLMIARSLSRKSPQGYIDLNDPKSINEVEAQLEHAGKTKGLPHLLKGSKDTWKGLLRPSRSAANREAGAIGPGARDKMLSDYAAATNKVERQRVVAGIEKHVADQISIKYGFTPEEATKIYAGWAAKRQMVMSDTNRFSAARYTDESGQSIPVDHFMDDGGALSITPPLRSQMQRSHVFLDMDQYDQALRLHGSGLKAVMRTGVQGAKLADHMARTFQSYWKLGVFMRLGFPVRQVGDDLFGQVARFGLPSMMARMRDGGKNLMLGHIQRSGVLLHDATYDVAHAHVANVQESLDIINKDVDRLIKEGAGSPDRILSEKIQAGMTQRGLAQEALVQAKQKAGEIPFRQGENGFQYGGIYVPGAFEGESGALAKKLVSADENQYNMLGISSENTQQLLRSGHWEILSPGVDEARHLDGWLHVGQHQFGKDALARRVVAGQSRAEVQHWLVQTPEGRAYYKDLGLKHVRSGELYDRVKAEVDQYFPPEHPELRDAIKDGTLTRQMLKDAIPKQYRPDIHSARTDFNMGKGFLAAKADKAISGFYKWFATMPQDMLSRNPLYAQQYEAHAKRLIQMATDGGQTHFTPDELNAVIGKAHNFAKRDTLRFVADMAHKSNAAQALGAVSPFFNATQEAFSRWGRVIMDDPKNLGHMIQFFQGPAQMGLVVDSNGNKVDASGYAMDPATGKKYLVPQGQRNIMLGKNVIPWLKKGSKIAINQDSLNFMFPSQPVGNPGVGPLVQVGLNEFAKDKPALADFLQHAGILPFGVSNRGIADQLLPSSVRAAKDYFAADQSTQDYQNVYLGVMQSEYAKHGLGWRPKAADLSEIKSRTKIIFALKFAGALGLPFSSKGVPANQYLINEYRRLQTENYKTADDKFYAKYGDAAFAYTAHLSKENAAVPATKEGYAAFKKYRKFISRDPELAALYIGQDGKGNFNVNAYQAELGTAIGGAESAHIRAKQSPADAMRDAQRREGWVIFNKYMKQIRGEMVDQGISDIKDAPELQDTKKALTDALSDPSSPYYNPAWTKDYFTFDSKKYDRIIPGMKEYANDPAFKHRADQKPLREYLDAREHLVEELKRRKQSGGAGTLAAKANSDLSDAWNGYVGSLIEQSTSFETLHNRFLHKDLNYEINTAGGGG